MSNSIITGQIQSEIARLERELEELETRKKRLKVQIRNHRKALRLVGIDGVASDFRAGVTRTPPTAHDAPDFKEVHP